MRNQYLQEWLDLLITQNFPGWQFSTDKKHIVAFVPPTEDLEEALFTLQQAVGKLKSKVKSKPEKIGFFVGNVKDSKYWELDS